MSHGYMREFDERSDQSDERDRNWRHRDWRPEDRNFRNVEGDRGLMFGDHQGHYHGDDRQRWREGSPWERFSSQPDDHYRSWRQQQIDALDQDYADYCREREQQFHQDFDSWRGKRKGISADETAAATSELELTHERTVPGSGKSAGDATSGTRDPENTATARARR